MSSSTEFGIWLDMRKRCTNPNAAGYANYGARGIKMCPRWARSFTAFYADMGPRPSLGHSIDRLDNDGDYEPGNCRWATLIEQANNKRNNIKVTIDGVTKSLSRWAAEYGVLPSVAWLRHKNGAQGAALFASTVTQLTHNGITDSIAGWSKRTGIRPTTITMRVNAYGWTVERALTQGAML